MKDGPEIAIVVAIDNKRGIGRDGKIPWRIPEDVQRFKDETMGHSVIMGRKTYDSIPSRFRPLEDRQNIVVTRDPELEIPGVNVVNSLAEAIEVASEFEDERICVIGGAQIYKEALPLTDVLYLTRIEGDFEADTFFPEYQEQFSKVLRSQTGSHKGINYTFEDLTRKVQED